MLKNRKNGFTLVELVVVIAILGILAGIAIPRFMEATKAGRGAKIVADMRTIESAVNVYYASHGAYPTDKNATGFADIVNSGTWPSPPVGSFTIAHTMGDSGADGPTSGTCDENTAYTYTARDAYDSGDTVTLTGATALTNCADTSYPTVMELLTAANAGGSSTSTAATVMETFWDLFQDTIAATGDLSGTELRNAFTAAIDDAGLDRTVSQDLLDQLGITTSSTLSWYADNNNYTGNSILFASTSQWAWSGSIAVTEDGKVYVSTSTDSDGNTTASSISAIVGISSITDEQTALETNGFTYSGLTIDI